MLFCEVTTHRDFTWGTSARLAVALLGAACTSTTQPFPGLCEPHAEPLGLSQTSELGFSPEDAISTFESERSVWAVSWRNGGEDTFVATVIHALGAEFVRYLPLDGGSEDFCASLESEILVETELMLATADGELSGSGAATMHFSSLTTSLIPVDLEWDGLTLAAERAAEIEAQVLGDPPTGTITRTALVGGLDSFGLTVWWTQPDGSTVSTAVYDCSWDETACMEMRGAYGPSDTSE